MKPSKDSQDIEAEAADWFARQLGEHWTDADEGTLEAWLNAATAHRIAFVRLSAAWQHSARLTALGAGLPAGTIPPRGSWSFSPFFDQSDAAPRTVSDIAASEIVKRRGSRRIWSLAASLLLAIVGAGAWFQMADRGETYRTAIGRTDTIPLQDGSRVMLNTDSKIRVALNETERRIELDRGEAFFDVAKDKQRPFTVVAGAKRIVAVGTKFSVRRTQDDVVVVVAEGRVRLDGDGDGEVPVMQLDAGAVAQTKKAVVSVQRHPVPEVEQILSWRRGYVTFRDTELTEAVEEFNRYSVKKIRIRDASIEHIRIGGNFRTDDAEAFLWLLENGFPVRVERGSDEAVLTRR